MKDLHYSISRRIIRMKRSVHSALGTKSLLASKMNLYNTILFKHFRKKSSNRDRYSKILKFVDGTISLLGCRVLSDGRISWWTYSPIIMASTYWILASYTVYYHSNDNQLRKAVPALCLLGISISVCAQSYYSIEFKYNYFK